MSAGEGPTPARRIKNYAEAQYVPCSKRIVAFATMRGHDAVVLCECAGLGFEPRVHKPSATQRVDELCAG